MRELKNFRSNCKENTYLRNPIGLIVLLTALTFGATAFAKETASQFLITLDLTTGNIIKFTDEHGNTAHEAKGPVTGTEFGEVLEIKSANILRAKGNPDNAWIFIDGNWYHETANEIVVAFDIKSGDIVKVTDKEGNLVNKLEGPVPRGELGEVVAITSTTILQTKRNPNCVWVEINGVWYWICDG